MKTFEGEVARVRDHAQGPSRHDGYCFLRVFGTGEEIYCRREQFADGKILPIGTSIEFGIEARGDKKFAVNVRRLILGNLTT